MTNNYQVYLISDSTGETLDRIFLALQSQFPNFTYKTNQYAFTRTENQIEKIFLKCEESNNSIILYSIVDSKLAKYLSVQAQKKSIPCFDVLGNLILSLSKLLNQKASHKASAQHVMDAEYYKRIEAIQFTMSHDDGKKISDLNKSDIILLGVSRTSKTPTSIYLANRGYKTCNIPLIVRQDLPENLTKNPKISCVIGLIAEPARLSDVRKNRINSLHENRSSDYTNLEQIVVEIEESKKLFKKFNWPIIDVTRKSVEETAASVIKIYDIVNAK